MKAMSRNILLFDKTVIVILSAIVLALIVTVMSAIYAGNYQGKNNQLKAGLTEIQSLSGDIIQIKSTVESKEKKLEKKTPTGVVSTLEQILTTLEMKAQVIKPLGKTRVEAYSEENAEMEIAGADLNGIVNLLYKINVSPLPLKIKAASVRSTFEDPDKFILKLTVSLMSK